MLSKEKVTPHEGDRSDGGSQARGSVVTEGSKPVRRNSLDLEQPNSNIYIIHYWF